jgi:hypothetical protein
MSKRCIHNQTKLVVILATYRAYNIVCKKIERMMCMIRLKAIVNDEKIEVIEEKITTLNDDDIVMDMVSYDIIGNMEFEEQFDSMLKLLPKWLEKLVRYYLHL